MKSICATAIVLAGALAASAPAAFAQRSPCYSYPSGSSKRIACLRQEEAAARQYANDMNGIAHQLRRDHENIGRGLGLSSRVPGAPAISRALGPAWDAPRYVYDGYQAYERDRNSKRAGDNRRE